MLCGPLCVIPDVPQYQSDVSADTHCLYSCRSGTIAITPSGEPPGPPSALGAMCHAGVDPMFCSAGIVGDEQIHVVWSPPLDDGGSPITGYVVWYGKWDLVMSERAPLRMHSTHLVEAIRLETPTTGHVIPRLENDMDYVVVVEALNKYGNSSRQMSGRFTPKFCEVAEGHDYMRCVVSYGQAYEHMHVCKHARMHKNFVTRSSTCT
jgi:hypothetical protein